MNQVKKGRPQTNFKKTTKTSQIGTKEGETRATFIVNENQLAKIKALAYWERTSIKNILNEALASVILKREKRPMKKAKK